MNEIIELIEPSTSTWKCTTMYSSLIRLHISLVYKMLHIFLKTTKLKLFLDQSDIDQGLDIYRDYIKDNFDRLVVLIHLLMLQSDFRHITAEAVGPNADLYVNMTVGKSFTKLSYNQVQEHTLDNNLILTFIRSGTSHADLNLKCGSFNSTFLKINLDIMSKLSDARTIVSLANDFKDRLLNPFKYSAASQVKLINGLADLPVELFYRLAVTYLNIRSVVSLMRTSKHFMGLLNADQTSCNSLWFLLFKRDWVTIYTSANNRDWLESNANINFRTDYIKKYRALRRDTSKFYFPERIYRNF